VDVRRLVSGLEQVLYGTRRGAAVPELANGTNYSSGTAAVDRLVGSTNGAGVPLAPQVQPMPVAAPMPAAAAASYDQSNGYGTPMPAPTPMPMPTPMPAPMPAAAQMPVAPAAAAAGPSPFAAPQGPTPPGVPARGGLTAAQVRGTNGLTPAPASGWPNPQAQSWPNAAGMGQTG
jgi:hypothetical protein